MLSDILKNRQYDGLMGEESAHIRLKLDTDEPIALSNFVGSFVGLGNQFEKFVASEHPGLKMESEFFVKEVRAGCIEADLIAVVIPAIQSLPGIIDGIDKAQILGKFVSDVGRRISSYFVPGGRDTTATKSDLSDFHKTVGAIAVDPDASGRIEAAMFEDGERKIRSVFVFTASEARVAQREIEHHRAELSAKSDADHERVLLRFVRPSVEAGKPGKPGGERGVIEKLHSKPKPILYASDLAEQRVKHELLQVDGNVFRTLFDVDVNVEMNAGGRPIAYRIMAVHAVVDSAEEDDDPAG